MKIVIKPRHWFLIGLFILLVVYASYQARFLILGPQISIQSPQNGQTVRDPLVTIEGFAKNIAWISLNGRQIFTDEDGRWSEELIVASGTSIMKIQARDRLGRETEKQLQIVLK